MNIPAKSALLFTLALTASFHPLRAALDPYPVFEPANANVTLSAGHPYQTSSDAYATGAWSVWVDLKGPGILKLWDDDFSTLQVVGASGLTQYNSGSMINLTVVNKTPDKMVNFKIELRLDPGTPSTAGPSPAGDGVSFGQDVVPKLNAIGTGGIGSTVTISPAGSQPDSILFSNINLGRGIDPGGTISFLFPVTSTLTTGPAAVYFLLTPNPSPPVITRQPESQKVAEGAEVSLEVDATGAGQLTYQWKKDGLARPGATNRKYTIPNFRESDAGSYSVDVSNSEGTTTSRTATLAFNNEGQYLGDGRNPQLTVAVIVRQDDTGTVIAHDRQNNVAIQQPIRVRGDRTFTEDGPITLAPAAGQARGATVSGRIASGQVSGELGAARLPFTAIRDAAATGAAPFQAGYYLARALGTAEGATYAVVGPSGRITVVTSSVSSADSAAGLLNALGQLAATTTNGAQLAIALNAQFKTFEATLRPAGIAAPIPFLGLLDGILASARLVNLSILTSLATPGDTFTIGTVIGGASTSGNKPLLVRAAGPALTPLGVGGALPDPKLDFFQGQTVIAANDNWGGTAALAAVFNQVGAFAFPSATSRDAAVFNPALAAGGYTVAVGGVDGATGAVIAELYDATPTNTVTAGTPRLVNVSVLKPLGAGEILTAGFVIGGLGPKQVLIRAVGPTLGTAPFNVPGAMSDPKVELFSGQTVIASNDNWGGGAGLVSAFSSVAAFSLPATSRDAAVVAVLQPGNYTAQVSGVAGGAGAVLVEVYEVQ